MHGLQLRHWKERSMVRWICGVRDDNEVPSTYGLLCQGCRRWTQLSELGVYHWKTRCTFLLMHRDGHFARSSSYTWRHVARSSTCTWEDTLQAPPHAQGRHVALSSSCTWVDTLQAPPPHAQAWTLCMLLLMHRVWTLYTLLLMHRGGHVTRAS